ncbi:bifunctional phosphopantothenoylcysteine decarboxylase/phosphopantothenate--cysteine ligase CoaBC, partial [Candidatus Bipolaricaulota bacterium]|nr:bifunctional phosphopantothenoylcysteine decarboxylase/phosphopantothenate--cysteine ligase CoaBC [Candidatus Bipolaricaulota bacterium]
VMAKLAHGIADDLLTCTALATRAPILIAPAMHTNMWTNAATQTNVETLHARGVRFVGPAVGRLASGGFGAGRFAPVPEILGEALKKLGKTGDLAGRKLIVTAGGTREPIDPVRFLGNRSTGKMGYALAEAARDRGAIVTLISGAASLPTPAGVTVIKIETAANMLAAVEKAATDADVLIMAAAVADYAPSGSAEHKLKKGEAELLLRLTRTEDILDSVRDVSVRVGFAAESEDLIENAKRKLESKNLDLIVANDISRTDSGFGTDENQCTILDASGDVDELPLQSKRAVAEHILDRVIELLNAN